MDRCAEVVDASAASSSDPAMGSPLQPDHLRIGLDIPPFFLQIGGMATLNIKNLPDDLYKRLQQRARRQHRSVAQEVTCILEQALSEPELLSLLDLEGLGAELWAGVDPAEHVERERGAWEQ